MDLAFSPARGDMDRLTRLESALRSNGGAVTAAGRPCRSHGRWVPASQSAGGPHCKLIVLSQLRLQAAKEWTPEQRPSRLPPHGLATGTNIPPWGNAVNPEKPVLWSVKWSQPGKRSATSWS